LLAASGTASLVANFATQEGGAQAEAASSGVFIGSRQLSSARSVAAFAGDGPVAGVHSADGESFYWLMSSGRVFRLHTANWVKP
jgi:hypothetical protein